MKKILLIVLSMFFILTSSAHATLIDRGGGMIYDSDLNITWLQDANYANTTGYDDTLYGYNTNGLMTWADAMTWAQNLEYGGYSDWRLPTTLKPDPSCNIVWWSMNCTGSEMGHLFYTELGNKGYAATDDTYPQPGWGLKTWSPFNNLQWPHGSCSWSSTEGDFYQETMAFCFEFGAQGSFDKEGNKEYAWAVRSGDVSAPASTHVPEPGTLMLLGSGLAGMVVWRKKNSKQK